MMKLKVISTLVTGSLLISSAGWGAGHPTKPKRPISKEVYYGDYSSNRAFVINVNKMKLKTIIEGTGLGPYETDYISKRFAYVINRDETSLDVVNTRREKIVNTIPLDYKPRSIVRSPNEKLGVLSGKSEPWSTLIDLRTNTVRVDGFKDSNYQPITDFGGGNATGHPYWVSNTQFLLLDRTENAIELYSTDTLTPQAKLLTSSSIHHIFKAGDDYYAVLEGKRSSALDPSVVAIAPGIVKFTIDTATNSLNLVEEKLLSSYTDLPSSFMPSTWGAHHASLHPDGTHIYIGSYEGTMFVINKDSFALVDTFNAGLGLGHIAFIPERNLAITTNHYTTFKTIVNVSDPTNNIVIKNLEVAQPDVNNTGKRLQSHTSHSDPDGKYFYSVSSLDGVFYSINLDTLEVEKTVKMENAYPLMGAFITDEKRSGRSRGHRRHNHL